MTKNEHSDPQANGGAKGKKQFPRFKVCDTFIEVTTRSLKELLEGIENRFAKGKGFSVATMNLDHIVKLRDSEEFRHAYRAHDFVVADGNPIVWIANLSGRPIELVPGSELIEPLTQLSIKHSVPLALVGGTEETLENASKFLTHEFPGVEIAEKVAPTFGFDPRGSEADQLIQTIRLSKARLCFLALGAPTQEIFAVYAQQALRDVGFVSVGAGLDFLAGAQVRAPVWVRRIAMEWLWRMMLNPRRLFVRYFRCACIVPSLAIHAFRQRLSDEL